MYFRPVNKTSFSQLTATLQDPLEEVVCRGPLRQRGLLSGSIEEFWNESSENSQVKADHGTLVLSCAGPIHIPSPPPPLPGRIADSIRNQQVLRPSSPTSIVYCDWILYTLYQTNQVEHSGLRALIRSRCPTGLMGAATNASRGNGGV